MSYKAVSDMTKAEKFPDLEKLIFSPKILKPYQLYQGINFSDTKCNID